MDRHARELSGALGEYLVDVPRRNILLRDLLRQRSEQCYAHKAKALPHVLSFDTELVLDAWTFGRPVNYLLAWIEPPIGTAGNLDEEQISRMARREALFAQP